MKNAVKIVLSILLLICLFDLPYGFYELIRFIAFVVFGYLAYDAVRGSKNEIAFAYGAFALLFQPFLKISLGHTIWNLVDVLVAVALIVSVYISYRRKL